MLLLTVNGQDHMTCSQATNKKITKLPRLLHKPVLSNNIYWGFCVLLLQHMGQKKNWSAIVPKWQKVCHLLITTIRHLLQGILPFCCCPEFSVYTHTYHKPPIVNKAHQMMRPLPSAQIAYEATASELPTATNDMIHTRTHAHTHTHAQTRTHTRTCAHTHTHTHI